MNVNLIKKWLRNHHHPAIKKVYSWAKIIRTSSLPVPRLILCPLYYVARFLIDFWHTLTRFFLWTPLFKGRLKKGGKGLYLYNGMPFVSGPVEISIDENCRISGQSTFSGRTSSLYSPILKIGKNVDIGWQTTIAVGQHIIIKDNVRIAGRAFLAGYPGHPLNYTHRIQGLPDHDNQVDDIVLENNVWLATGVFVMAGVTIGEGTVVAAGSVVTKNLPPYVLAGGVPARVLRELTEEEKK